MLSKTLSVAALASAAYAQGTGLAAALTSNNQTSSLVGLLSSLPGTTESLSSLSNITLLAPSNAALARLLNSTAGAGLASNPALLQAVLQYHILNGTYPAEAVTNSPAFIPTALVNPQFANVTGGQRVEAIRSGNNVTFYSGLLANSTVSQANINFTGGVIHVIDHVLTVPQNVSTTLVAAGLSSLYGALNATNLLDTVNGLRDVTIFAPANSGFQAVGSALQNASLETLQSVLTYHVVQGSTPLYSPSIVNGTSLPTVNGASVTLHTAANGTVFVNGARVITPNVLIAGGVVHVIDNLLNPNATSSTNNGTAFAGAQPAPNPPFTSSAPTPTGAPIGGGPGSSSSNATRTNTNAASPMFTGAVGMAALFGAGAVVVNL